MSQTTQPSSPPSTLPNLDAEYPPSTILSNLDAEYLESQGLLLPRNPDNPGTRRLHRRRLTECSDREYRHLPLSGPDIPPDAFVTIPDILISRETLLHVGLSEARADDLWQFWTNWSPEAIIQTPRETDLNPETGGDCITFLEIITTPMRLAQCKGEDASCDTDAAWTKCMDDVGISAELQSAIMDEGFREIRTSDSCLYWVLDTIEMRYAALEMIQRTSLARDKKLRGRQSSQDSQQRQRPQETPGIDRNGWSSAQAQAARNLPGHTVLFKAIDLARIHGINARCDLLDEAGNLQSSSTLWRVAPSDFSYYHALIYLAVDPLVAEYQASYTKRRSMAGSVVIVSVAIPNSALESLREPDDVQRRFFPNPDWKDLVWFSRREKFVPSYREYKERTLIIGTMSKGIVGDMVSSSEEVSERNVLKVGRRRGKEADERRHAVQYAFTDDDGIWFLEDNASFEVATYTAEDAQAFCNEYTWAD